MLHVSIYEQECCGTVHYRVVRDDGRLIFDRLQTDFPERDEAISAVTSEFRRSKTGPFEVHFWPIDRQANGRRVRRLLAASGDYRDS